MTDRPIIFSGPMVRALMDGRKTQTRRIISRVRTFALPDLGAVTLHGEDLARAMQNAAEFRHLDGDSWSWQADAFAHQAPATRTTWMAHIGYAPGDRLWVREAWAPISACTHDDPGAAALAAGGFYRADDGTTDGEIARWRPSIHMPRSASRITLVVADVRIQRLQDISEDDAKAEGPGFVGKHSGQVCESVAAHRLGRGPRWRNARDWYADLWDTLHGRDAWAANPWVVALTFRPIHANIDDPAARVGA